MIPPWMPVPVRRGPLPRKAASRIKIAVLLLGIVVAIGGVAMAVSQYTSHSWRFRIESSDQLEIAGTENVSKRQIMDVMGADIGRNVFFVPLDDRKKQLEEIPWVESASVIRLLPNRLKVEVQERVPVGFLQIGSKIALIDSHGVAMEMPPNGAKRYSFPVIIGTGETEPLSTRAARMKIYGQVIKELDADGAHYSQDLSEVDLSDPDDVKVTVNDPQGAVLVHLGSSNYADRFKVYKAHVQQWREQFPKLDSVDLRYDRQVIVNPDSARDVAKAAPPVVPAPKKSVIAEKPVSTRKPVAKRPATTWKKPASAKKAVVAKKWKKPKTN
jgi:cell division protein FtsQ